MLLNSDRIVRHSSAGILNYFFFTAKKTPIFLVADDISVTLAFLRRKLLNNKHNIVFVNKWEYSVVVIRISA